MNKKRNSKRRVNPLSLFDSLVKISITSFCCLFIMINIISVVSAAGIADAFKVIDGGGGTDSDGAIIDPLDAVAGEAGYDIRAAGKTGPFDFISPVFNQVIMMGLSFLGVVFVLLMIYGGFLWMSDQGNEEQVKKAKGLITAAVIGLVIVISSYAISILVVNTFAQQTLKDSSVTE